jgi:predicted choloylglycine hydrolase
MGRQYGKQTSDLIRRNLADAERVYSSLGVSREQIDDVCRRFEDGIGRQAPNLLEQLRGAAEGANIALIDYMRMLFHRDVQVATEYSRNTAECTLFGAVRSATSDGSSILAQNSDSNKASQDYYVVTTAKPEGGFKYLMVGQVQRPLGHTGINEKGLALVAAGVRVSDGAEAFNKGGALGVPLNFIAHILEECRGVDEAIEYSRITPRGLYGCNRIVVDEKNIVGMELSHAACNMIEPQQNTVFATNHYVSNNMSDMGPSMDDIPDSYIRYERIRQLVYSNQGRIDVETAKKFMADHGAQGLGNICSHGHNKFPYTNASVIFQPKERTLWVARGNPCENEYLPLSLR